MSIPTDEDLASLVHVPLTSDLDWDPSVLDVDIPVDDWTNDIHHPSMDKPYLESRFLPDGSYLDDFDDFTFCCQMSCGESLSK